MSRLSATSANAGAGGPIDTRDWERRFAAVKDQLPEYKRAKADAAAATAELEALRGQLAELQVCVDRSHLAECCQQNGRLLWWPVRDGYAGS